MYSKSGGSRETSGMKCVFTLILLNCLMYFFIQGQLGPREYELRFSYEAFKDLKLWQPLTYMFLHADFWHLAVNMWGLYLFGSLVAPQLGALNFLEVYVVSGISGCLLWVLFNWNSYGALLGASGAVFGIMMITAMLQPNIELIIFPIFIPLKVKTMVVVFAVIEIISNTRGGIVAHTAHLGGLVGAYLVIRIFHKKQIQWDPLSFLFSGGSSRKTPPGWKVNDTSSNEYRRQEPPPPPREFSDSDRVTQGELDRILDKIADSGINSLSESEMNVLRRAREQMKNNRS